MVHGLQCKMICQRVFGTVGDKKVEIDLNEALSTGNGRKQSSEGVSRVREV